MNAIAVSNLVGPNPQFCFRDSAAFDFATSESDFSLFMVAMVLTAQVHMPDCFVFCHLTQSASFFCPQVVPEIIGDLVASYFELRFEMPLERYWKAQRRQFLYMLPLKASLICFNVFITLLVLRSP